MTVGARPDLGEMDAMLRAEGAGALLQRLGDHLGADVSDRARGEVESVVRLAAATLDDDPDQLPAQLLARLDDRSDPVVAGLLDQARGWDRRPWLRPLIASLASGRGPLRLELRGHEDAITAVALTPDGRQAVSGGGPRTIRHWDLERGVESRMLRGGGRFGPGEGYGLEVNAVAADASGTRAASIDGDGRIHVWDLVEGTLLREAGGLAGDDEDWLGTLSPGLGRAACAFEHSIIPSVEAEQRGTIEVFDLDRAEVVATLSQPDGRVRGLALSADGQTLVTAAGVLRRWDIDDGTAVAGPGSAGSGRALAITGDAGVAVTGHEDGSLGLSALGPDGATRRLAGHGGAVRAVAVTPDGHWAASGADDATVRVWDLDHGTEARVLAGHVGAVRAVAITPDARWVLSGGDDRVVRLWDLEAADGRADPPRRHPVEALALSADGRRALATAADGTREVWDLDGGAAGPPPEPLDAVAVPSALRAQIEALEAQATPGASVREVQALALTPGGERALCAARHWTVVSGHHRWAIDTTTVRVWDLTDEPVGRVLAQRSANVVGFQRGEAFTGVAVSADGHLGAAVGDDGTVRVWDLDTGTPVGTFTADGPLRVCALSSDGRTVAAGGVTGDVHLLRLVDPGAPGA